VWLRERLAYLLYLRRIHEFKDLFAEAELLFAPGVRLDLLPTDVGHAIIALTGLYETKVTRRIAELARAGGRLIDVGANYGYYTCLWVGSNDTNVAVAIEASPRNVSPLTANIRKNGFADRVFIQHVAAGEEDGLVGFITGPQEQSGWGGIVAKGVSGDVDVQCMRMDTIVEGLGWDGAEVLKVDVEGAEARVLQGAQRVLRSHELRHVFFEDNPVRMNRLGIAEGSAQALLKRFGYRLERLTQTEWYATASG
jgi:FkbM family methyltransferase